MKILAVCLGLTFSSIGFSTCYFKDKGKGSWETSSSTDCKARSSESPSSEYVEVILGPGFKTITFFNAGSIVGTSVHWN